MFTVEPPFNSQNDRVYAPIDNKKRYINPMQPSATHVGYGVRCRGTSGYDWTDICQS